MIEIKQVGSKKDLKAFARFAVDVLYRDCKLYVPSLYADELSVLNPKKNFSLEHCEVRCFLAYKDGKIAGRIAGIVQNKYNEISGRKCIRFSRFDCIDDAEVAKALLAAVEAFGKKKGMDTMHGPWGFNDQDREGLLTYGFDRRATYVTNYNYEYYEKLVKDNGFTDESEWLEYDFTVPEEVDERISRISERIKEKLGVRDLAESMSMKKMVKEYGYEAIEMTNAAYASLDCYVPVEGREVENIFQQFVTIINPRYFSLLVNRDDEVVGMGVILPSVANALIKSRGRLFPFGIFRLLHAISRPGRTGNGAHRGAPRLPETGRQFADDRPHHEKHHRGRHTQDRIQPRTRVQRRRAVAVDEPRTARHQAPQDFRQTNLSPTRTPQGCAFF